MRGLRLLLLAALVASACGGAQHAVFGDAEREDRGWITVIGTVTKGVEQGCYLLRTSGHAYLLIGSDPDIRDVGARLIVRGDARPGTPTTCLQGVPLYVSDARPL